jgi:regulator of cell morphogenesis and NO signaling
LQDKLKIMKTLDVSETTVAELVAENYRTAEVFKKYGIDFCCGGKKKIEQVCADRHIDVEQLENDLKAVQNLSVDTEPHFTEWPLVLLADYIIAVHHKYVNNNLGLITEFAEKVARVHGEHNPENIEILKLWKQVVSELTMHMKKEELVLFPYIKNIERYSTREIKEFPPSHFGTVNNPIRMMEQEHELAGSLMKRIEELSHQFTPPSHACNTYKVLYAKLREFQEDLFKHIHLENNILFPRAAAMEARLH